MPSIFSNKSLKEVGRTGAVNVGVGAGVGVAEGVGIGIGVTEGVGIGIGVTEGVGVGAGTFAGVALTTTPLLHTNFLPDLTQVNFFSEETTVCPAFLHTAPGLTAALEVLTNRTCERTSEIATEAKVFFMTIG